MGKGIDKEKDKQLGKVNKPVEDFDIGELGANFILGPYKIVKSGSVPWTIYSTGGSYKTNSMIV